MKGFVFAVFLFLSVALCAHSPKNSNSFKVSLSTNGTTVVFGETVLIQWTGATPSTRFVTITLTDVSSGSVYYIARNIPSSTGLCRWVPDWTLTSQDTYQITVSTNTQLTATSGQFPITYPKLLVTAAPLNVPVGGYLNVTWTNMPAIFSSVEIYLYCNGTYEYDLADPAPNTGSFSYLVSDTITLGSGCNVIVYSSSAYGFTGTSNNVTFVAPHIQVWTDQVGDELALEQSFRIYWSGVPAVISGATLTMVCSDTDETILGSVGLRTNVTYTIPAYITIDDNCSFVIQDVNAYEIRASTPTYQIIVPYVSLSLSPDPSSTGYVVAGSKLMIRWTNISPLDEVCLYLLTETNQYTINCLDKNPGFFSWVVWTDMGSMSDVQIEVVSSSSSVIVGYSEVFDIDVNSVEKAHPHPHSHHHHL